MLSLMSVRDGGRLRSALQHLDMTPPEPGFAATATRFRRSYMLAAALPLLTFVALVLIGVTWERGVLSERFAAANREQADTAERALESVGEAVIRNKARDVAGQLAIYFRMHRGRSFEDMRRDPELQRLAVQPVGETGYTALTEAADSYAIRLHPNPALVDRDMRSLAESMPDWWRIVEAGIHGREADGRYQWVDPDGAVRTKYMVTTPVAEPVDGVTFMVSATTYVDEFSAPAIAMRRQSDDILGRFQRHLAQQWVLLCALALVVLAAAAGLTYVLGNRAARRFIAPIDEMAAAVRAFGGGVGEPMRLPGVIDRRDEFGTLARALRQMSQQLRELFSRLEGRLEELHRTREALEDSERHHKALYEEARRTESRYRSLIRGSADAIVMLDTDLRVTFVSPAFTRMFGWTDEDLNGRRIPYIPPEDQAAAFERLRRVLGDGDKLSGQECQRMTRHGRVLDVSISASRFEDHEGRPAGLLVIIRDISEQKRIEAEMHRLERVKAIGTLAGGIAHDFNNLLMVIQGNVSLLQARAEHDEDRARLASIEEQIESGARLTSQLLGYARKGRYDVSVANLNDTIRNTGETFRRTRKQVRVHYDLASDLAPVEADFSRIEQVLLNLYLNAADAMPEGGDLWLSSRNVPEDELGSQDRDRYPDGCVELVVADTGVGMAPEVVEQIFDPFFTTKDMGRGTGLGLASAFGIVDGHGGTIGVTSVPGQGSAFTIRLPATGKAVAGDGPDRRRAADPEDGGRGTVLFVDDEDMVLRVGTQMLERLGYTVIQAAGGEEAVERYRAGGDDIDLVLLDMVMPGMSGSQVFDTLRALDPHVAVLLSTGYSIDGRVADMLGRGCLGYVQKPYSLATLAEKIDQALAAGGRAPPDPAGPDRPRRLSPG